MDKSGFTTWNSEIPSYLVDGYHETGTFVEFINNFKNYHNWMIFSDYCFGLPEGKNNLVITATIIPFDDYKWIKTYSDIVGNLHSKDIKESKLSPKLVNFVNFINKLPAFHVSIVLDENFNFYKSSNLTQQEYFIQRFEGIHKQLLHVANYGIADCSIHQSLKNIKAVINNLNGKNMKTFRQTEIVSSVISSIIKMIADNTGHKNKICWCSDRDDILTFLSNKISSPFIFEMIKNDVNRITSNKNQELIFFNKKDCDYDNLIRIPDFIAGTLCDLDLEKITVTKGKFLPVLYELLTNKEKNLVLKLVMDQEKVKVIHYRMEKVAQTTPDWKIYNSKRCTK